MNTVLEVQLLRKSYGSLEAVAGVSFSVARGSIFGLLGHNGAGKTTTLECILGTRSRDAGSVSILGMDSIRDRRRLFERVGVQFQNTRFQDRLRVGEACALASALYREPGDWRALLEKFGLNDKIKTCVNELSGGERQKLAVLLALIPDPELLFLDELTTGLDPVSRRAMWQHLLDLKKTGVSIVLTSHYMDEVERLCDNIALMKDGVFAASGTPEQLIMEQASRQDGIRNLEDVFLCYMNKEECDEA